VRAAVVVPAVFAVGEQLLHNADMALFAAFGSVTMLRSSISAEVFGSSSRPTSRSRALLSRQQARILGRPRPRRLAVTHPCLGTVFDQAPLRPHILEKALLGLNAEEWLGLLNGRVLFWLVTRRLEQLLTARGHRGAGRGRRCPGHRRPRHQRAADFGGEQLTSGAV